MITNAAAFGHSQKVSVVQQATPPVQMPDEWQHIEITGEGRKITIALNGTTVGIYEVERYGGHVLFDNRKGRVQFRNIRISETEPKASGLVDAPPWLNEKITRREGPKLVREVRPIYTPEAMKRGVQGEVHMTVVVMPDGSTSAVHVTRSLDPDLDLSAIAAVREWKFKPGLINGRPVPMFAEVEMTFQVLRR